MLAGSLMVLIWQTPENPLRSPLPQFLAQCDKQHLYFNLKTSHRLHICYGNLGGVTVTQRSSFVIFNVEKSLVLNPASPAFLSSTVHLWKIRFSRYKHDQISECIALLAAVFNVCLLI